MRFPTVVLLTASLGLGAACATTEAERTSTGGNLLEAAEIEAAGPQIRTALDAVELLRPQFLRTRANPTVGGRRVDPVQVYVNGTSWGGPESLSRLRAEEVVRIRYIRPTDAQTRFGMDHGSGAMEVTTTAR
jgi:hypothetical protein